MFLVLVEILNRLLTEQFAFRGSGEHKNTLVDAKSGVEANTDAKYGVRHLERFEQRSRGLVVKSVAPGRAALPAIRPLVTLRNLRNMLAPADAFAFKSRVARVQASMRVSARIPRRFYRLSWM